MACETCGERSPPEKSTHAHYSAARTSQASRQHCSPPAVGAVVNNESRVGIAMGSSSSPSDGVSRSTGMRSMGAGGSAGTQLARHEHPEGAKSLQKPTHESEGAVGEAEGRGVARVGDLVGATLGDLVGDAGASVGRRGLTGASVGRTGGSTGTSSGRSLRICLPVALVGRAASAHMAAAATATAATLAASDARRRVAGGLRIVMPSFDLRAARAGERGGQRRMEAGTRGGG